MEANVALGISTTHPRAGVVAAVVAPARPVGWTVGVDGALWFALHIAVALCVRRTGAFAFFAHAARRQSTPPTG